MPILEYHCKDCGGNYEIFHKVKEVVDDIECPGCRSHNYKRLMSVPSINSSIRSDKGSPAQTCEYANTSCCSGNCDLMK